MFTGIIEKVGAIESLEKRDNSARIQVNAGGLASSLAVSSSIAVNGCCLTVVDLSGQTFAADLSGETLRRTSLGQLKTGLHVNLERPLSAGKELGGHFVQGHVDAVGCVIGLESEGPNWWLRVRVPPEIERYVAMKGSIAIDGISLTVAGISDGIAEAAIIPFTYSNTNLQSLVPGDAVNLEADILAKYVERLLNSRNGASATAKKKFSVADLIEQGF
jgi:riboflavin synthase